MLLTEEQCVIIHLNPFVQPYVKRGFDALTTVSTVPGFEHRKDEFIRLSSIASIINVVFTGLNAYSKKALRDREIQLEAYLRKHT